jgi:putative ABC transport system substrate-binding protein
LGQLRAGALVISANDPFIQSRSQQLAALALHHAVPAVSLDREFVVAGGLMSYSGSVPDMYRTAGIYAGRILKGEKPGELPVQRATKFDFVVNLKTAKTLGLTIPETLLVTADEVLQ